MRVAITERPVDIEECSQSISEWSQYFKIEGVAIEN